MLFATRALALSLTVLSYAAVAPSVMMAQEANVDGRCNVVVVDGNIRNVELNCAGTDPSLNKALEDRLSRLELSSAQLESIANRWVDDFFALRAILEQHSDQSEATDAAWQALRSGQIDLAYVISEELLGLTQVITETRAVAQDTNEIVRGMVTREEQAYLESKFTYYPTLRLNPTAYGVEQVFFGPIVSMNESAIFYPENYDIDTTVVNGFLAIVDRLSRDIIFWNEFSNDTQELQDSFSKERHFQSFNFEVVYCLSYYDERLEQWTKQFDVLLPDTELLEDALKDLRSEEIRLDSLLDGSVTRSDFALSCSEDLREEPEYQLAIDGTDHFPTIEENKYLKPSLTIEDIGLESFAQHRDRLELRANPYRDGRFHNYVVVARARDGRELDYPSVGYPGEDYFELYLTHLNGEFPDLGPVPIEGFFEGELWKQLANISYGNGTFLSCDPGACQVQGMDECYATPPIVILKTSYGKTLLRHYVAQCESQHRMPEDECFAPSELTSEEIHSLQGWLEFSNKPSIRFRPQIRSYPLDRRSASFTFPC